MDSNKKQKVRRMLLFYFNDDKSIQKNEHRAVVMSWMSNNGYRVEDISLLFNVSLSSAYKRIRQGHAVVKYYTYAQNIHTELNNSMEYVLYYFNKFIKAKHKGYEIIQKTKTSQ